MKLVISIDVPGETEESVVNNAKWLLELIEKELRSYDIGQAKCSLTRDNDRSGGNLLLPRLNGRFGEHLQGRKATIKEVLELGE